MEALALLVGGAVLGAVLGYLIRRGEHLREKRLDAFSDLAAAFIDAARTGATLLSVHMRTGYPHELNPQTLSAEQIEAMSRAHGEAWIASADAAHRFEFAVAQVELVASKETASVVTDLRVFLDGAVYSGIPWKYVENYPTAKLNPVDIVPRAIEAVRPHVHQTARKLWGYSAPKPPKVVEGPKTSDEPDV
jgi:hypothetical protein